SWFVPFTISFALFPLRKANPPLFSTLMFLVVLVVAGLLLRLFFLHRSVCIRQAALAGLLWTAMNLILDYPMFAFGPMQMTPLAYYSEIGLVYLTFPIFALLSAPLAKRP
ncbi:MAG: hypothetical protein WBV33_22595, partial [Terracidiphilus sp.]